MCLLLNNLEEVLKTLLKMGPHTVEVVFQLT